MKRNLDLARLIVQRLREKESQDGWLELTLDGFSPDDISYHVYLLSDAGLVDAQEAPAGSGTWKARGLRWAGHEFFEVSRNKILWKAAKSRLHEQGIGVSFDLIKSLLLDYARAQLAVGGKDGAGKKQAA